MEGSVMLVLSRKVGESIFIDGCIKVTVLDVDRGKIRLGIEAPHEVRVLREELLRRLQEFAEPACPEPALAYAR